MTAAQWLGLAITASPFVAIIVYSVRELGWGETLAGVGFVAALVAVILTGTYLLSGGAA